MRPTLLAALAALAALATLSTARADTKSVAIGSNTATLSQTTTGSLSFGLDDCKSDKEVTFTGTFSTPVPSSNSTLAIFLSDSSSCSSPPAGKSVSNSDNTVSLTVSAKKDVAGSTCPEDATTTKYVCLVATSSSLTSSPAFMTLTYHSQRPDTPTLKSTEGGDKLVHVNYSTTGTLDHVMIYYQQISSGSGSEVDVCGPQSSGEVDPGLVQALSDVADAGAADSGEADAGDGGTADAGYDRSKIPARESKSTSGDIVSGLENGATYLFFVVAVDQYGNESWESNALYATPHLVQDFYRRYRCNGGQEAGGFGCTTAGTAALVPAFGALAFALLRRRGGRRP